MFNTLSNGWDKMDTLNIEFKVEKNRDKENFRVDEYIDGELYKGHDYDWTENQAIAFKNKQETTLNNLTGSLVTLVKTKD